MWSGFVPKVCTITLRVVEAEGRCKRIKMGTTQDSEFSKTVPSFIELNICSHYWGYQWCLLLTPLFFSSFLINLAITFSMSPLVLRSSFTFLALSLNPIDSN